MPEISSATQITENGSESDGAKLPQDSGCSFLQNDVQNFLDSAADRAGFGGSIGMATKDVTVLGGAVNIGQADSSGIPAQGSTAARTQFGDDQARIVQIKEKPPYHDGIRIHRAGKHAGGA